MASDLWALLALSLVGCARDPSPAEHLPPARSQPQESQPMHDLPASVERRLSEGQAALSRGTLSINDPQLTDAALARALEDARVPSGLIRLELSGSPITAEGVEIALRSPKTRTLQVFGAATCPIGDEGLRHLAGASKAWPHLRSLGLQKIGASAEGVAALAKGLRLPPEGKLQLGFQPIDLTAAEALSALPPLDTLDLTEAEIAPEAARQLLQRGPMRALILDGARLGPGALKGLSGLSPRLAILDLRGAQLGAEDVEILAALEAPALAAVDLTRNPIGDQGVKALAAAPWRSQLRALSALHTEAGPEARAALQRAWGEGPGLTIERP